MTPGEKARETRARNREAQKEKDLERREIREKMKSACLRILDDPEASSADQLKATQILYKLTEGRSDYGEGLLSR